MDGEDWEACTRRVGSIVARAENSKTAEYAEKFSEIIYNMDFLPGGRILRNAGRPRGSMFNCYVLPIGDSREEIGQYYKDSLILWGEGGGIGTNISFLRPKGADIKGVGGVSSGPVSFLKASDAIAETVESGGSRRAAGLALMNVSHPDIGRFIDAKTIHGELSHYNISVAVTDDFLEAVESNSDWEFKFAQKSYGKIKARKIWNKIIENMIEHAEPGLLNWDKIIKNNSYYFDSVIATNPCGEAVLAPYEVCDLGSLVLTSFITGTVNTNWKKLEEVIKLAIRFLDDVTEVNKYVLKEIDIKAHNSRRVGLGMMGLAEYLFAKKMKYGSDKAVTEIEKLMRFVRDVIYETMVELASEKGAFPMFDPIAYGKASFIRKLPASLRMDIKQYGVRCVTGMALAPTGCQSGDSLVVTSNGILKLTEIGNGGGDQWQNIDIKVAQENCSYKKATKFFINGEAPTKKILLSSGVELECTFNHKYRILRNKNYIWSSADKLIVGDLFVIPLNTYFNDNNQKLKLPAITHGNQNPILAHNYMNSDLAEFLGIYYGDGSNHNKGIRISCNAYNTNDYMYVANLGQRLFNINPTFENNGRGCMAVCFNSQVLLKWLRKNELFKQKSKDIEIPNLIRTSSRDSLVGFIKGMCFADGHIDKSSGVIFFNTASKKLALQLITIFRSLGSDASMDRQLSGKGSTIFRVRLIKTTRRCLTDDIRIMLFKLGLSFNCTIDEVVSVENSLCKTFDIEVPETITYISNSVISHNTISLLADVTSGIEPLPFKAYKRKDRVSERIYIHPTYKDFLLSKEEIPDWYVDSNDLKPSDHFEVQSIVQKYTDGAVSKTINMPKNTTPKDLSKLLLEYIYDLKGVTIYVDGSREGQILNKITEKESKEYLKKKNINIETTLDESLFECASGSCEI